MWRWIIMYEYFFHYYISYGPLLVLISIFLTLFYWFVANWSLLRATYSCISLKNTITGNLGKCFNSREGTSCQNTDLGHVYGWCNDEDNYGPLPGSKNGPYSGYCAQWSWCKGQCPPYQCPGDFPKGIGKQDPQVWGWCDDKGVERSMIGTACGPRGAHCNNWVWDVKKCPTACQKPPPMPLKKRCPSGKNKCQLVCGSRDDGSTLNCPPPKCGKNKCQDKCICEGPPADPWKPYENKTIRIRAKDKPSDQECHLQVSELKGGIKGITQNEKAVKFNCSEDAKGDTLFLEKSKDGKYRLVDTDGCTFRWSGRKGGNRALGTDERVAKFDCGGDNGDPFEFEGTPDDAQLYSKIAGKKCGLQWSSVKGQNKGIGPQERVAKFDCNDKGDKLVVDMA